MMLVLFPATFIPSTGKGLRFGVISGYRKRSGLCKLLSNQVNVPARLKSHEIERLEARLATPNSTGEL